MRRVLLVVLAVALVSAGREAAADPLLVDGGWSFGFGVLRSGGEFARRFNAGMGWVIRSSLTVRVGDWGVEGAGMVGQGRASNPMFAFYDVSSFGVGLRRYVTLFTRDRLEGKEPTQVRLELYGRFGREWIGVPEMHLNEMAPGWGYGLGLLMRLRIGKTDATGLLVTCWFDDGRARATLPNEDGKPAQAIFTTWTAGFMIGASR